MTTRYRTEAINDDGGTMVSRVIGGMTVPVTNPLSPDADLSRSNPEQLLALAWATCLDATLQAIVKNAHRTRVRVEVELQDSPARGGYEFHVTAFVSAEGRTLAETEDLVTAAHDRCPISRLLQGASTVALRAEAWAG
ncbi:OsmC family protein [Microbacterium sp. NPDC077663]|uniref:OsmC family protein n=1 Tax=Microbacterium sp. NPDC077663 TaxID=3364189 RepID=UPI0037C67304